MVPSESIEKSLELQCDMIFHSTIPDAGIEKKKGIVIEEIGKDLQMPGAVSNDFFKQVLFNPDFSRKIVKKQWRFLQMQGARLRFPETC
ncbi:MAG: hypothetical protein A2161_05490 [Candidatus Schekmanbacteria bacterium RBG_13_48_7]|uniref:Uncharacterized protein n=1 Tax=Candidatus Schekmanbacteria bacterium RBG_13_48_7 TaxID=1817878 RepID=A0A1F7S4H1_9BACT|nr:MAG: hypothetical protein A2161_05490 [Candidatus Schekmanbacteria bacterium RBG_13_48_7]